MAFFAPHFLLKWGKESRLFFRGRWNENTFVFLSERKKWKYVRRSVKYRTLEFAPQTYFSYQYATSSVINQQLGQRNPKNGGYVRESNPVSSELARLAYHQGQSHTFRGRADMIFVWCVCTGAWREQLIHVLYHLGLCNQNVFSSAVDGLFYSGMRNARITTVCHSKLFFTCTFSLPIMDRVSSVTGLRCPGVGNLWFTKRNFSLNLFDGHKVYIKWWENTDTYTY